MCVCMYVCVCLCVRAVKPAAWVAGVGMMKCGQHERRKVTHLVVSRAPCVQLASHRPYELCKSALVGCVNVLIPLLDHKRTRSPLLAHLCVIDGTHSAELGIVRCVTL